MLEREVRLTWRVKTRVFSRGGGSTARAPPEKLERKVSSPCAAQQLLHQCSCYWYCLLPRFLLTNKWEALSWSSVASLPLTANINVTADVNLDVTGTCFYEAYRQLQNVVSNVLFICIITKWWLKLSRKVIRLLFPPTVLFWSWVIFDKKTNATYTFHR